MKYLESVQLTPCSGRSLYELGSTFKVWAMDSYAPGFTFYGHTALQSARTSRQLGRSLVSHRPAHEPGLLDYVAAYLVLLGPSYSLDPL